ncbi:WhiB family transcriptional regulator [Nonomuraea sp. NPDC023979]|uniref:WhiB family transcriptional regulator n=1 Tax=Nonomuraea sp. NPDC023979 TaxID=3154796 RepID=UPI00340CA455
MNRYAKAAVRHDAEWLLQNEKVNNDITVRKQRARAARAAQLPARRGKATTSPILITRIPAPTAPHDARQVLAGWAVEAGATVQDLADVLDALGLRGPEYVTAYTDKGERRRQVAPCPDCERPYIQLRTDGTFISHPRESRQPINDDTRCPGSGQPAGQPVKPRELAPVVPITTRQPSRSGQHPARGGLNVPQDERAACRDADPEVFFPRSYGRTYDREVRQARAVCAGCPLADACLTAALDMPGVDGIWAGTTPHQRKRLARGRALPTERSTA